MKDLIIRDIQSLDLMGPYILLGICLSLIFVCIMILFNDIAEKEDSDE